MSKVNIKKHSEKLGSGYQLENLLTVIPPRPPKGYAAVWRAWYDAAMRVSAMPELRDTGEDHGNWRIFDLTYRSTDGVLIGGWVLIPKSGKVERGFVVGHGYAGRLAPEFDLQLENSALLFLCARGLSRSPHGSISEKPFWHVLHDIQDKDKYVLRGCVEDTWLGISALLRLFPAVEGRVGYLGTSFGGGVGAMAMAWDDRVQRAYLRVPSFGHHPLRMKLKTIGSAYSVQKFEKKNPGMASYTLAWYDAAIAAKYIKIPVLCACAQFDPVVAPPGQFAIYNGLAGEKELFLLEAGHMEFEGKAEVIEQLNLSIGKFFKDL